jgi:hypothetical protein
LASGLRQQQEGVDGVAVLGQCLGDEAVVAGIAGGGEEHPVEPDPAELLVVLVLVPGPLGDLDDHVDLHGHASSVVTRAPAASGIARRP